MEARPGEINSTSQVAGQDATTGKEGRARQIDPCCFLCAVEPGQSISLYF